MNKKFKKLLIIFSIILGLLIIIWQGSFLFKFPAKTQFGVTFSAQQATDLGLNWKQVYISTLDDLQVKKIRIPVYWDHVERVKGAYDLADIDWQMNEARKRKVQVILAIGQRVPRWPECHRPEWLSTEAEDAQNANLFKYLKVVTTHYKDDPSLEFWQVENEPFLNVFGDCSAGDKNLLLQEVAEVKSLDAVHPVLITDSGELSAWLKTAPLGDYFGFSVYRSVHSWTGNLSYNHIIPPLFYRAKAWLTGKPIDKIFISELQAEPWSKKILVDTSIEDQEKSFDLKQFKSNVAFSQNLGFSRTYAWGVEWWYWKKSRGDASYWEFAKTLFK